MWRYNVNKQTLQICFSINKSHIGMYIESVCQKEVKESILVDFFVYLPINCCTLKALSIIIEAYLSKFRKDILVHRFY